MGLLLKLLFCGMVLNIELVPFVMPGKCSTTEPYFSLTIKSKFYININTMNDTKIAWLHRRIWAPCSALFPDIDIDCQSDKNCQRRGIVASSGPLPLTALKQDIQ